MKRKLIFWLILFLVVLLLGFVPQYQKARGLSQQLDAAKSELASCHSDVRLSQVLDLASMTYLETNRKNYGIASGYASRLFDLAQQLSGETSAPSVKAGLNEMLASRDAVTAGLAAGDAASLAQIEKLLLKAHDLVKNIHG
jgi:hypothetical protein